MPRSTSNLSSGDFGGDHITDRALPKLDKLSYKKYESSTMISFLLLVGGTVRMIAGAGDAIEDFLDAWLERDTSTNHTRPEFLNNPALHDYDEEDYPESQDAAATADGTDDSDAEDREVVTRPRGRTTFKTRPKPNYRDLPQEAKLLDAKLFIILRSIITEPEIRSLLENFKGRDARYTYAVMGIYEHVGYSAATRRLNAMTAMQSLKYNGDPSQWKLEAMAATREIFAAGVTMEHFVLQCVQQSFKDGNRDV